MGAYSEIEGDGGARSRGQGLAGKSKRQIERRVSPQEKPQANHAHVRFESSPDNTTRAEFGANIHYYRGSRTPFP